jgi:uncharacterized protein
MVQKNFTLTILVILSMIGLVSCEVQQQREPEGQLNANGQKTGLWIEYYEGDKILRKINYKDGLKNGEEITYHRNGQVNSIANFYNGFLHGAWKKWHENGALDEVGEYKGGKAEGRWVYYFYSGNKRRFEGYYKQNLRDSHWVEYFENGTVLNELLYRDGKIVPKTKK